MPHPKPHLDTCFWKVCSVMEVNTRHSSTMHSSDVWVPEPRCPGLKPDHPSPLGDCRQGLSISVITWEAQESNSPSRG